MKLGSARPWLFSLLLLTAGSRSSEAGLHLYECSWSAASVRPGQASFNQLAPFEVRVPYRKVFDFDAKTHGSEVIDIADSLLSGESKAGRLELHAGGDEGVRLLLSAPAGAKKVGDDTRVDEPGCRNFDITRSVTFQKIGMRSEKTGASVLVPGEIELRCHYRFFQCR